MVKKIFTLCLIVSIITPVTWSNDSENSLLREEVKLLKQKLSELENRLQAQEEKAVETDRIVSTLPADIRKNTDFDALENKERMAFLEGFSAIKDNYDFVSISGNIDIVGFFSDIDTHPKANKEDTSDIIMDELRLNLDIDIAESVSGFIGLQYEDYRNSSFAGPGGADTDQKEDTLYVDEAYVFIGGDRGIYSILGKQYMPFGNINEFGNFINDTLTRQLYETRDTGAVLGMKSDMVDFSLFVFNGQNDKVRGAAKGGGAVDNKIDTWGASLSIETDNEDRNMRFGISYINNIYQAQNTDSVAGLDAGARFPDNYSDDDNGAINLYSVLSMGPVWFSAEYVGAINDLDRNPNGLTGEDIGFKNDTDVKPQAYTLELGLTCPVAEREYVVAVKYEANIDLDDFSSESVSDSRVLADGGIHDIWGLSLSTNLYENTMLTLNWEYQTFADTVPSAWGLDGGGHANIFLAELSIDF